MAINRRSTDGMEFDKFVESPSRPGMSAVEVVGDFNTTIGDITVPPSAFNVDQVVINTFGTAASVAQNIETTIVSYLVPAGKKFSLSRIDFSGSNIAKYNAYKDAADIGVSRTMFGSGLSGSMVFSDTCGLGLLVSAGETVIIKVVNPRSYVGDFEAKILGVLADV